MSDESTPSSLDHYLPTGGERRRWPRDPGAFSAAIGRARLLPHVSRHYPSLRPNGWYKMIGQNPEALEPIARQGYLWIDVDGRPRQVWAGHFEAQLG
jgi:hypothetical protein